MMRCSPNEGLCVVSVFKSVLSVMCEFIHEIFTECATEACVLIWILALMKNKVKGTRTREGGPER